MFCCFFRGDLDTKNSDIIMEALINLNRNEGITCVFVTHDVALKYFAHRVIHMLDGKIQRIEHIPQHRRAEAEYELSESLKNVSYIPLSHSTHTVT